MATGRAVAKTLRWASLAFPGRLGESDLDNSHLRPHEGWPWEESLFQIAGNRV